MKEFINRAVRTASSAVACAALLACMLSCERIYDYEGDCDPHWQVKFIWDYDMNFADAFAGPMGVGSVHLYVYDATTHALVLEKGEVSGPDGFAAGWTMPIEELPMGRYDFVAWCGTDGNDSFTGGTAPQTLDDAAEAWRVSDKALAGAADADRRLKPLYYGRRSSFELYDEEGVHTVPIHLMKDTNEFTIMLQHRSKAIDPADFEITITDDNTVLRWDNGLWPGTEETAYRAWSVVQGTAADAKPVLGAEPVENNLLIARLSTSRLVCGREGGPRLTIRERSTERVIFEFPLIEYLLMPGFHHAILDAHNETHSIPDQEYLDREDTWSMHFILDDDLSAQGGWYALELHILAWHVILDPDVELH